MNYKRFLEKLPKRMARTECRFDLRIYVHPQGSGFLFALNGSGKTIGEGREMVKIPYTDRRAALRMLDELLAKAEKFARKIGDTPNSPA